VQESLFQKPNVSRMESTEVRGRARIEKKRIKTCYFCANPRYIYTKCRKSSAEKFHYKLATLGT